MSNIAKDLEKEFSFFIRLRDSHGGKIRCPVCHTEKSPLHFSIIRIIPLYSERFNERNAVSICLKCATMDAAIKQKIFELYGVHPVNQKYERLLFDHIFKKDEMVKLIIRFKEINQKFFQIKEVKKTNI